MIARSRARVVVLAILVACGVGCHTRAVDGARDALPASSGRPASAAILAPDFDPDTLVPGDPAPGDPASAHDHHDHGAATTYTCTHHPDVRTDAPGKCPRCGMDLVPMKQPEVSP